METPGNFLDTTGVHGLINEQYSCVMYKHVLITCTNLIILELTVLVYGKSSRKHGSKDACVPDQYLWCYCVVYTYSFVLCAMKYPGRI